MILRSRLIVHVYTHAYTHIHKQKKITDYKVRNKIYNDNYSYLNYKREVVIYILCLINWLMVIK